MTLLTEVLNEAAQADPMWFAFGKYYGRGETETIKVKILQSVIVKACTLAEDDEDALDDFMDDLGFKKENAIQTMWEEYPPEKCIQQILDGFSFGAMAEEFAFGYGKTVGKAKAAFLDIEDEAEDEWE